ncbi:response regulator [Bradymonadaceae bacterium TMQ3]|uniref:Response regulator n=1 Tax=Lujinxingia sediminis TaxID=2480984 RepID=A0ABY0CS51_9DELT|nr:response regulator [Lujinxingia sediminis]RDV38153.1 response regulator [Bradymonadaceae bacterium TMQ3]RVU43647.1 response regulator [Lujinxingia sediminis]TXC75823.1 response regulator [Bradymonadales bacterium TMQ1]
MDPNEKSAAESIDAIADDDLPFGAPTTRERPLILLADDDGELRGMLKAHFSRRDCDLLESMDGAEALEKIIEHRPNLVVLDVMMPELTGWEVCKYVRQHEIYEQTAIIMLTGIGPTNNELTSPLFGADDYIDKPFDFEELKVKVAKVLEQRQSPPLR